jgi:hypothetical protein
MAIYLFPWQSENLLKFISILRHHDIYQASHITHKLADTHVIWAGLEDLEAVNDLFHIPEYANTAYSLTAFKLMTSSTCHRTT